MTLAFSLVEIVLAVGIISFALVGILGMFPIALDAATRSREETQAAFIARSIYSDLAGYPSYLSPDENTVISLADPPPPITRIYDESGIVTTSSDSSGMSTFAVAIELSANDPSPGLTRIDIEVATPGDAPASGPGRRTYSFVSVLRQRN